MKLNKKQRIIGLQGAAGVGKTAIARKLCKKLPGKTARISIDILRDMSCISFKTQRESDEHILSAKRLCPNLIKSYIKEGFDNIVVEIAPPVDIDNGETDKFLVKSLKKLGGRVFLLTAPIKEVLKRNSRRKGEFGGGGLPRKLAEKIYNSCDKYLDKTDFEIIDTEKIGADKTTSIILEKLK